MGDPLMDSLPDEVRAEIERPEAERQQVLEALGEAVAKMRDEAITARKDSGVEEVWMQAEEAYCGIDDENRAEFRAARWAKPMTMEGPLVSVRSNSSDEVRATAFVGMTARYVDAAAAKVVDITLPIDGPPFTLDPTPVPEMSEALEDNRPAEQVTGRPMPGPDGAPVKVVDLAKHRREKAEKAAKKATDRIYDWMVESRHNDEMAKAIFDMARLGVCVLKGPVPDICESTVVRRQQSPQGAEVIQVERVRKTKPVGRWVDPWNFYPAPGCGEDIHRGGHVFEAVPVLEHELRARGKNTEAGYIPEAIERVISEGPGKVYGKDADANAPRVKKLYAEWVFTGTLSRKDFEAANPTQAADLPEDAEDVFCVLSLVNDTVIRAVLSPLDTNRIPYRVGRWRRRVGHWAGRGVAEQIRTPQRIINAATRALLNNAGKSSGSQVVMDPSVVQPANNDPRIVGDKLWWLLKDSGVEDVRKVFAAFQWPNTTPQLMSIIEYAFRLAEESCNIPLITQGQSGKTTPDTFGGQQLQDNNANQLLRDVGRNLNWDVTSPLVDHYYEWLLLDPEVPSEEKGDYKVNTSGALALIEKSLQDQTIAAMGGMVLNPAFGLNPKTWAEAWLRSKRLSPSEFQYTEAEQEAMAKQPPPEAPAVTAAKIRAEAQVATAQSRDQLAAEKIKVDTDRDTLHVKAQAERTAMERESQMAELMLRRELAMLDYANKNNINIDRVKADLAKTTMELSLQRELAGKDGKGPQVADPVIEPEGRAPEGEAFQK